MRIIVECEDELEFEKGHIWIDSINEQMKADEFVFCFSADVREFECNEYTIEIPEEIWLEVVV